jgi:hypothetical protein
LGTPWRFSAAFGKIFFHPVLERIFNLKFQILPYKDGVWEQSKISLPSVAPSSRGNIYSKGGEAMPQLTQMELNTIKELALHEDVNAKKFQLYAQNCQNNQLQAMLTQEANRSSSNTNM